MRSVHLKSELAFQALSQAFGSYHPAGETVNDNEETNIYIPGSNFASFGGRRNATPDQEMLSEAIKQTADPTKGKPNRDRQIGKKM